MHISEWKPNPEWFIWNVSRRKAEALTPIVNSIASVLDSISYAIDKDHVRQYTTHSIGKAHGRNCPCYSCNQAQQHEAYRTHYERFGVHYMERCRDYVSVGTITEEGFENEIDIVKCIACLQYLHSLTDKLVVRLLKAKSPIVVPLSVKDEASLMIALKDGTALP